MVVLLVGKRRPHYYSWALVILNSSCSVNAMFILVRQASLFVIPSNYNHLFFNFNTALMGPGFCNRHRRRGVAVLLNSLNNNKSFSGNDDSSSERGGCDGDKYYDDDDMTDDRHNDTIYHYEFSKMKKEMFGRDIPCNDELVTAAQNSENDFLAAMLEQTQQFQQIKLEMGSERACEVFMERIQAEDEADRRRESEGQDGKDRDDAVEVDSMLFDKSTWYVGALLQKDVATVVAMPMEDDAEDANAWQ